MIFSSSCLYWQKLRKWYGGTISLYGDSSIIRRFWAFFQTRLILSLTNKGSLGAEFMQIRMRDVGSVKLTCDLIQPGRQHKIWRKQLSSMWRKFPKLCSLCVFPTQSALTMAEAYKGVIWVSTTSDRANFSDSGHTCLDSIFFSAITLKFSISVSNWKKPKESPVDLLVTVIYVRVGPFCFEPSLGTLYFFFGRRQRLRDHLDTGGSHRSTQEGMAHL